MAPPPKGWHTAAADSINVEMAAKNAVFDDALSFYRYLTVSKRERDWGLFVTGTGHEIMKLTSAATAHAKPYPYSWKSFDDQRYSVTWDPNFPDRYKHDWNHGRTFVDEYSALYFNIGSTWLFESETTPTQQRIEPGSIVLLFPGVWHRYRPELDATNNFCSTVWCAFGGEMAQHWQKRGLISPRQPVLRVKGNPTIDNGFRRIHNGLRSAEPSRLQHALAGALVELIGDADSISRLARESALPADVLHQAKLMLEDLAAPDVDPQRVANMLNIPYDQFRRAFKVSTGLSPHQYRLQSLLRQAKQLLEGTNMSIKMVAVAVHFSDQHYFSKAFKHKVGVTPSEWRAHSRRRDLPRSGRASR